MKRARASWYASRASACRPARYSASMSCLRKRLAQRVLAGERLELADHVAVQPELELGVDPLADHDEP